MAAKFPMKEIIEVLKNLNRSHDLNKKFERNEISISSYCSYSDAIFKLRAVNFGLLIIVGGAFATKYNLDGGTYLRDAALMTATIAIATAATFNFAFNNIKDVYFETSKNREHFKTRIIDETTANINKDDVKIIGSSLNSDELYKSLMWGNSLYETKTGDIVNTTKKILKSIQEKWSTSNINIWKTERTQVEEDLKTTITERNKEVKRIITDLYNHENSENKRIIENLMSIKKYNGNDLDAINKEIKRINELAIIKATELYNNQAIELIFLKVVSDFSKGIKHDRLLGMLKDLSNDHIFIDKQKEGWDVNESFYKISEYAGKMIGGRNILQHTESFADDLTLTDIAKDINPKLISKQGKIKFVSFHNLLINQKDAAIKNFHNIKSPKINEIDINKLDLDKIISIQKEYEKDQKTIDKNNKLDKQLKVGEIYRKGLENRGVKP